MLQQFNQRHGTALAWLAAELCVRSWARLAAHTHLHCSLRDASASAICGRHAALARVVVIVAVLPTAAVYVSRILGGRHVMHAQDVCSAIQEYDDRLRNIIKHGDDVTAADWAQAHRSMLWQTLAEYQVGDLL
jgi:hypothetical protein